MTILVRKEAIVFIILNKKRIFQEKLLEFKYFFLRIWKREKDIKEKTNNNCGKKKMERLEKFGNAKIGHSNSR